MDFIIPAAQLILSLSILVILHELGHFIPAKLFGTRVEKFYLFFDPWVSLFKKKIGETEYGIGWLPLGGYVKISGMIDESMDIEQMKGEPQPWEFRSKTAWQRLIIMIGGVTVNFILGVLIFIGIVAYWGESYIPNENIKDGIAVGTIGEELGLRDGDKIISIGDAPFNEFVPGKIITEIAINNADNIKVERNGQITTLPIADGWGAKLIADKEAKDKLFTPRIPFEVSVLEENSTAYKAGLRVGDRLSKINGQQANFFSDYQKMYKDYFGKNIPMTIIRNGENIDLSVPLSEDGLLGIQRKVDFIDIARKEYTLGQAIPAGYKKSIGFLSNQMKAFGQIFKGKIKAKDSVGSFITIGKQFGTTWNWFRFWSMTAMLSLILGFINLLPIPALDGGHVMFLLFEFVTGIKPSDKFLEYATTFGFFLLMALMVYALGLDIVNNFF